jgi:hypothetical protein
VMEQHALYFGDFVGAQHLPIDVVKEVDVQ